MAKDNHKKPKYSFIIPAYNASSTIARAIRSISALVDDCEIIVAENGSDDGTTLEVMNLMEHDKRIHLIHTEKGVSKARNRGISDAEGEWLLFVDADDVWLAHEKSLNSITDTLNSSDMIVCSYLKDNKSIIHPYGQMNIVLSGSQKEEAFEWMLKRPTLRMTVWGKLYKKEAVVNGGVFFDEKLRLSEDADFLIRFLSSCGSVAITNVQIYNYCTDAPSVIRSFDRTRIDGYLNALETIAGRVPDDLEGFTDFVLAHLNLICVHNIFTAENELTRSEKRTAIKSVLNNQVIRDALLQTRIQDITDLNKVPALLFKHKLYLAGGLVCHTKALMNKRKQKNT